jgi:hypothetical protein
MEPLRARVPRIAVRLVAPKDAQVQVDGAVLATALLGGEPFRVDVGEHVISARATGYELYVRSVKVADGETTAPIDITLVRPSEPAPPVKPIEKKIEPIQPPAEPSSGRSYVAPVAASVGALALAGIGLGMYIVAGNVKEDADRTCPLRLDCDDEKTKVRTFDALALGSFIGAVGLAGLSVVLWASPGKSSASTKALPGFGGAPARVVARPSFVGLEGAF